MNTAIIIQARMGSTRFPRKMVRPFRGKTGLLEYILKRLTNSNLKVPLILAIPDSIDNDELAEIGTRNQVEVFRGSENDVLDRFISTAAHFNVEQIIRLCPDNPFIDIYGIVQLIRSFENTDFDYHAFGISDIKPTILSHFGFWAEAITVQSLKKTADLTKEKAYREHVTNFIYGHPEMFKVKLNLISEELKKEDWARFTVDTETDFKNMSWIAEQFAIDYNFTPEFLISFVNEYSRLKQDMRNQIAENSK